jgi:flagellar basal-body rod protein FlgF
MLYGLYLSAAGVMTNSYRQDVIANNLANSETVGFKKDLATFRQRATGTKEMPAEAGYSNPLLDRIGGGTLADPTLVDTSQGDSEETGNPLDAAIQGPGFFAVDDHGTERLTRNGQFMINRAGTLIQSGGANLPVLDIAGKPIQLDGTLASQTEIERDGTIVQGNAPVARLGVVDVPNPTALRNEGATLFSYPDMTAVTASNSMVKGEFVEEANVDPATEMAALMDTQRQLEANANMIHYQDATLDKLVNTVGKIS